MKKAVDVNVKRKRTVVDHKLLPVKELFSIIAPEYDFVSRVLSLGRDPAWKRSLIRALPDYTAPVCLDLACGTGDLAFGLAEKYTDGTVLGVDITPEMINIAQCRNVYKNVSFKIDDMLSTDIESNSVDIITAGYSLLSSSDVHLYLTEIMRLLKPGGVVGFLDRPKPASKIGQTLAYMILKTWGSIWSFILHGTSSIYTHTVDEYATFPTSPELHQLIKEVGFIKLESRRYALGMIEMVTFEKRR